mmetsp:Transcript_7570/g.11985  ORF Transcript_7570/g.11985 Transcript_7570/m.11985 type:complete len:139 (-) Transcript_7570:245-661(-)
MMTMPGRKRIMKSIGSPLPKSFVGCAIPVNQVKLISVLHVGLNLVHTTAIFVIYGCLMMNLLIIVLIVVFAELVEEKISGTAMTVECVLTPCCSMTTTAKLVNTCLIAQSVRKICLAAAMHPMKCLVDMPFIGIASKN